MNFWLSMITLFSFTILKCENNCKNFSRKFMFQDENRTETSFYNFDSFSQLMNVCNFFASAYISFLPKKPIIINKDWNLPGLISENELKFAIEIKIVNIKGIDVKATSYTKYHHRASFPYLSFSFISLNVYSDEKKIDQSSECNSHIFSNTNNFLQPYTTVLFETIRYPDILCPLLFQNTEMLRIVFYDIYNSFLVKNKLKFYDLNESSHDLNTQVKKVTVFLYKIDLNFEILNKNLFKNLFESEIYGSLNRIESGVLSHFEFLDVIIFRIDNLKEIFHQGNKWFKDLNKNVKVNLSDNNDVRNNYGFTMALIFIYLKYDFSFNKIYEYSNEDICLFKDFPHERLVYPVIEPGQELKCSCTLKWIQIYIHLYAPKIANFSYDYTVNYFNNITSSYKYPRTVYKYCRKGGDDLECDFQKLFSKCQIFYDNNKASRFTLDNDSDIFFFIKWFQYILLVIFQPFLSVICILTNFLSIACIKNKEKQKEFKTPMYGHILVNCFFNIAYCVIMILRLVNTCVFPRPFESVFCSSFYTLHSAQYFKLIVILYLGNVFKLSANLSHLSFTLVRFILVTSLKDKKNFKKFLNLGLKKFSLILFITSSIFSLFILFQFRINTTLDVHKEFPYEWRDEYFCLSEENRYQCRLFNSFKIANKSLNDIVIFIFVLVIDLLLLRTVQSDLMKKSQKFKDESKQEEIAKSSKNIDHMVFTNGVIYVLAHFPEFILTILMISFADKIAHFCKENLSCDLINEEAGFFSLISILSKFYIFIRFNKTFKESFIDLKSRLTKYKTSSTEVS
jgi:hypothetical protein